MGAEVIKIEKIPAGDDTRYMVPPKMGDVAASFLMMNRNKKGIALDLKTPGGAKVLQRLIESADVLVENFGPGVMDRLGFGYADIRKKHPALIYCSLSGFGRTGPYKHRRGFDLVAQAMSGIMSFTGERPDGPPVKCGAPLSDITAGIIAAMGILAAYAHRLKTGEGQWVETSAKLEVVYSGQGGFAKEGSGILESCKGSTALISSGGDRIPIYGNCFTFNDPGNHLLTEEGSGEPASLETIANGRRVLRLGYDLFHEIRCLLTQGQPGRHAAVPTLELHISFLRDLILDTSIPLIEIPPVPAGYSFIACLTHDVDHPCIRNHFLDHTMFGFLYRATAGSVFEFLRGRKSLPQLGANWLAALSLPLVYLGLLPDTWRQFGRYLEIEQGLTSTFFVVPRKGCPVLDAAGCTRADRVVAYAAAEIADQLQGLQAAGREIGLHGLDAWADRDMGRQELEQIASLTGRSEIGVRMHWLCFDENSPVTLEQAGFSYDSSLGFNETVGYRSGTHQVFKPLAATRILELPMHIMDTALFFPYFLNLNPNQRQAVVQRLVENAMRFGGVLTINWHDRSIAPERLWAEFYLQLIAELKKRGAWIATAAQAVAWYRKRRSAVVEQSTEGEEPRLKLAVDPKADSLPGLTMTVHRSSRQSADRISAELEHACAT
jgi:hypothetical protein